MKTIGLRTLIKAHLLSIGIVTVLLTACTTSDPVETNTPVTFAFPRTIVSTQVVTPLPPRETDTPIAPTPTVAPASCTLPSDLDPGGLFSAISLCGNEIMFVITVNVSTTKPLLIGNVEAVANLWSGIGTVYMVEVINPVLATIPYEIGFVTIPEDVGKIRLAPEVEVEYRTIGPMETQRVPVIISASTDATGGERDLAIWIR